MFSHFDFPRLIIHAMGTPATISMKEMEKATANDAEIAFIASDMRSGWFNTSTIRFDLMIMPKIGGRRIRAKNMIIEIMYIVFLIAFLDDNLSKVLSFLDSGKICFRLHLR